jgi:6,7-dimethyl-8-ribityllumazine synthase
MVSLSRAPASAGRPLSAPVLAVNRLSRDGFFAAVLAVGVVHNGEMSDFSPKAPPPDE